MKPNEFSPSTIFYGMLAVSGILLLGPYLGIRFFSTASHEQSLQNPRFQSTPSVRRRDSSQSNSQSELQSIEDLLAK